MDHGHMDHGDMGHGDMGHGDMGSGPMCNMNMLFTWNTENLCIVFSQWRVTGPLSLFLSLVGVALLTAGYELVRDLTKRYESSSQEYANSLPPEESTVNEERPSSWKRLGLLMGEQQQRAKVVKALFYAVQVFYSFFIMLLFMTYNGYVMIAVAAGAFIGHLAFGGESATKDVSCH